LSVLCVIFLCLFNVSGYRMFEPFNAFVDGHFLSLPDSIRLSSIVTRGNQ
jgi:hypothetical protein